MEYKNLRGAGDVDLREVKIVSLNGQSANVINQVSAIEIYEDMFSSFISMSVVLRESVDFLNLFPFIGEEYLEIDVDTPTLKAPIKNRFYIYKITDRIYTGEREVAYTLKCISIEFLNDCNIKLVKPYAGNVSEIAFNVFKDDGLNTRKKINIDKTNNRIKMVPAFWSPVKCLSQLAASAISETGSPTFLFYENRDGFNFRSVNNILKEDPIQRFVKDNYSRSVVGGNSLQSIIDPKEDYKRILSLNIPVLTDYMRSATSGQLKSRLVSHDIVTKKYKVKDYNVKKDPNPFNLLNKNPAYSKYAIANAAATQMYMNRHYTLYNDYIDITNHSTLQRRISFFENLNKFKINIDVLGRTDYTVGKIVYLEVPKVTQITAEDTDYNDKLLSGKYLITAISHTINRESHTCSLELVKNSTISSLSE